MGFRTTSLGVLIVVVASCSTDQRDSRPGNQLDAGTVDAGKPDSAAEASDGACFAANPHRESGSSEPSLAEVKGCIAEWSSAGPCLEALFRGYLRTHSTAEALALLSRYEGEDDGIRVGCHPIAHAIGRETFVVQGTVDRSLAACNLTCNSGCFHGAMERFLRGDVEGCGQSGHISLPEIQAKVGSACDPTLPTVTSFQCLHGLGHAVMYFSGYDLIGSLQLCDTLADGWDRNACYGGIFMENIVSATPAARDLSSSDYLYPCSKVAERYRTACYGMQTSRMLEMGLSTAQQFEQCRRALGFETVCDTSIGRDLSLVVAAGDAAGAARQCGLGITATEVQACIGGVTTTLIADTQTGRDAFRFCASFAEKATLEYCFRVSVSYLRDVYRISATSVAADCESYAPGIDACREANMPD
jgi:hypothetical protein